MHIVLIIMRILSTIVGLEKHPHTGNNAVTGGPYMKKSLFLLAIVSLLVSCGEKEFYSVSVANASPKGVSYDYNGSSDTLGPSETKLYEVKAHTQPPKNFVDENGIASIAMENRGGEEYTFSEAESLKLNVKNTLPVTVTIKADNYIDNGGLMELEIAAGDEASGAVIYARNPRFTVTPGNPPGYNYPITVERNIAEVEDDDDVMAVIIR